MEEFKEEEKELDEIYTYPEKELTHNRKVFKKD